MFKKAKFVKPRPENQFIYQEYDADGPMPLHWVLSVWQHTDKTYRPFFVQAPDTLLASKSTRAVWKLSAAIHVDGYRCVADRRLGRDNWVFDLVDLQGQPFEFRIRIEAVLDVRGDLIDLTESDLCEAQKRCDELMVMRDDERRRADAAEAEVRRWKAAYKSLVVALGN